MKGGQMLGMIFDFDGTIADTLPICVEAFRRAAEPLAGKRHSDEEILATFGPSEEGSVRMLAPDRADECLEAYVAHYEELHTQCEAPFEGIRELLDELHRRKIRLALVTGKGHRSCEVSLRLLGLAHMFEYIETGCEHGPCKPAGIARIVSAWGVAPHSVAYIGDSPSDVDSARSVGLIALSAAWESRVNLAKVNAKRPDAIFQSVQELHEWLTQRT